MKVIFLDVDGVLNSEDWYNHPQRERRGLGVDPDAVARVHRIIRATGAAVVLSSTWRHGGDDWQDMLHDYTRRVGAELIPLLDRTPSLRNSGPRWSRSREISAWLADHPEVTRYLAIDDDLIDGHPQVKTTFKHGLTDHLADLAIAILNAG